ncbi:MAG: redox-regulated ATPase YchF [Epulopiscium sp. Nuni2H_MBin003]|nr:MAG: redox-regulated ATPase YchF [Epulopiscium sp. Nuni2H_MBin003]
MKLGIVGLPNVGKSTLFNALTKAGAESANYPFCTIEPNVGIVAVPDKRLDVLHQMYNSQKILPAVCEFVDIAGLIKGASKGEGLGNQFLSHIREVDAIVQVVRCFDDDNIIHVDKNVDPIRDIETINLELIFSDMELLERRIAKTKKAAKADKNALREIGLIEKLYEHLESGNSARSFDTDNQDDAIFINSLGLISSKPVLYAANVAEEDLAEENEYVQTLRKFSEDEGSEVFVICAKIEEELSLLDDEEKEMFLEDLGITDTGFDKLINASYKLLGLISYLTAGPKEVRAWTITKGTKAPGAAGKIHSDFERGFIRAEIVNFDDLVNSGSYNAAREKGLVNVEGKEYIVKDGDIILFRFNV